ncbi:MAG: hypothetical protein K2Y20_05905 [Sphingomonas sp.]|nr:hypothetical protein [Pirellulales bacterium]MBX9859112.1 hypothetical protein [Sphingomonas sp.]
MIRLDIDIVEKFVIAAGNMMRFKAPMPDDAFDIVSRKSADATDTATASSTEMLALSNLEVLTSPCVVNT